MANEKICYVPCTSKQAGCFRFIPFVSPSEDILENNPSSTCNAVSDISGDDASRVYNEIISLPSNSVSLSKKIKKVEEKPEKHVSVHHNYHLTIFHYAQEGNIAGIKCLISKGNNIDEQDMYGWTALMCSTFEGHIAIVEHLMKCGANLAIKNKQGLTALDIAMKRGHNELINLLKNGIVETASCKENEVDKEEKYCSFCKCIYIGPSVKHETSIVHLVNSKKNHTSVFYHIPENNKGFQIMLKKGWDKNKGLGLNAEGRKFPVKTILKSDRSCIGSKREKPKVTHFGPNDYNSIKQSNKTNVKIVREKTLKKWERVKLEKKNRQKEIEFRREFL